MEIDKSKGTWNNYDSSYLDDVAYLLYANYYFNKYKSLGMGPQHNFTKAYNLKYGNPTVDRFYHNAKLILRREKIEKILNNENR